MAGKYWENHSDSMNDEHMDMKDLADRVEDRGQYADMDEPTQEQFKTLIGSAMKSIFTSQDNHFAGRHKVAHSHLMVAGQHVANAARLIDGVYGGHANFGMAMHPKDTAEQIAMSYKHGFEV
jgi:hypothetical protein